MRGRDERTLLPYIKNLQHMVSGEFHSDLLVNMDESGCYQRPLKCSQKNCVFVRTEEPRPRFLDVPDGNHVSIVAAVALFGHHFLPLLLSTRSPLPEETQALYFFP
jgi:hypothetical protein